MENKDGALKMGHISILKLINNKFDFYQKISYIISVELMIIKTPLVKIIMTKEKFLEDLSKYNFDHPISTFMLFKELNGNGVGAGKMFENIFAWFVTDKVDGWYGLKLNLNNSDWCVHDVLVSQNPSIVNGYSDFLTIKTRVEKETDDTSKRLDLLHKYLNEKYDFTIGVSAKTYKDLEIQLTTSNEPRQILDENKELVINQEFDVSSFLDKLSTKTNEFQLILGLNTFSDRTYRLTNLDLNKLKEVVTSITFEKLRKHTRFFLNDKDGNKIIDFKYGGKTANAFQRGMWVYNKKGKNPFSGLMIFDSVLEGSYIYNGNQQDWKNDFKSLFINPI